MPEPDPTQSAVTPWPLAHEGAASMVDQEADRFARLSPFEQKNRLVALARGCAADALLNAGRGNPDWIAVEPREAFAALLEFALAEVRRTGALPQREGIAGRLRARLATEASAASRRLLTQGIDLARDRFGIAPDALVGEWVHGVLGDHYPTPVRMLEHAQTLVRAHLVEALFAGDAQAGDFDLFAVEGASAGIAYVFASLVSAGLLQPGDAIALGVPIFTPYLEVPKLPEYRFQVVPVRQDPDDGWRYPATELDKLRDPRIKAFLLVNPSNPTAVAIDPATVERIVAIVRERPDLILISDDVYASFVEGFSSLAAAAPRNTILLYSFSKFWGATGLRLGLIGLHASNAIDVRLQTFGGDGSRNGFEALARARYASLSLAPERLKLIDRMVADSRAVGMNHTAGLSAPQQVQMTLFALDALLDGAHVRVHSIRAMLAARFAALYRGLGVAPPQGGALTHYYATLDLQAIAAARHGDPFVQWLSARGEACGFVLRLAEHKGIVVLDGRGFDAPGMSVRVSLANLGEAACEAVGRGVSALLEEERARWSASEGASRAADARRG